MKRLVLPILSLLAVLTFQSCEGLLPDSGGEDETISVTPRTYSLSSEAGKIWVDVKASGKWTLSLDFGTGADGWASLSDASGSGSKGDVRLSYEANEGESRSVKLVLVSGSQTATATVEQAGASGSSSSGQYGYDVAPANLDWLELPAMVQGDGRELLIHDMSGGKYRYKAVSGERNWTCYWDYDNRLSIWVAYPLNSGLIGSYVERSEAWSYDPVFGDNYSVQQNVSGGYLDGNNGWYSRGHQIASADRLGSFSRNATTYYGTNMTPQDNSFNGGIWATLEGKVRDLSKKCDTLYVVTGCLVDGAKYYAKDRSGNKITVPTYYYKALLARGASSMYATDGYMAAGYILPHDSSIAKGKYADYVMSIDDLEQKTGIDFFPNLIKLIGQEKANKIESAKPASWWQ